MIFLLLWQNTLSCRSFFNNLKYESIIIKIFTGIQMRVYRKKTIKHTSVNMKFTHWLCRNVIIWILIYLNTIIKELRRRFQCRYSLQTQV